MKGEAAFSGTNNGWEKIEIDLTPFAAALFLTFRFDLGIDAAKGGAGWFIDDVHILDGNATKIQNFTVSEPGKGEVKIYPNPANPGTRIQVKLDQQRQADIKIYNLLGQLIQKNTLSAGSANSGIWSWDLTNLSGRTVGSGIYFIHVKTADINLFRKLVILQ